MRPAVRISVVAVLGTLTVLPAAAGARVLRVGNFHGRRGQYRSIQSAVDAARPGDWVLVAPGDWHERADHRRHRGPQPEDTPAGVVIHTPRIHVRGMNRNTTIVDGTLPGRGAACSRSKSRQDFGVKGKDGKRLGRNGILIWKANGVSVENLTTCNFLGGAGSVGNEIWWNGGDGSGKIGLGPFYGGYLNATTSYFDTNDTAAGYGLFSSNSSGPGRWFQTYASNFNDSDYYIGACQQVCNQVMDHAWAQYSALGYSGTNSGGSLVVKNSEFDHNKVGFNTNSQNNDDSPSPQDGACPGGRTSPITHTHSCWVFEHNYVHDNNNANVPGAGSASAGPVGTGLAIEGGRHDTVMDNRFANNGAWGAIFVPYPDTETPPPGQNCQGGTPGADNACLYDDWGNALIGNHFKHNGSFGNPSNGDFAEITFESHPNNCYRGNTDASGTVTSSPGDLQQSKPQCLSTNAPPDPNPVFTQEVLCDSQLIENSPCGTSTYPRLTKVKMPALPTRKLKTMPNPCADVPANPWCPRRKG